MLTIVLSVLGITALIAVSFMLTYLDDTRSKKWHDRIDHIRKAGTRMNRKLKSRSHPNEIFPSGKLSE
ncbi:MAG TPA: hypothetical protein VK826_01775 [Bacteroidia bacterium]|nr:hypothetical protein [Bacteroidia bacterium]